MEIRTPAGVGEAVTTALGIAMLAASIYFMDGILSWIVFGLGALLTIFGDEIDEPH